MAVYAHPSRSLPLRFHLSSCGQGCLVIFFSNFLALMIKAELARPDSHSSTVFAVILIIVNVLFFLSIWWNSYASAKAVFSRKHVQVS